jgi:hypothetical protein
MVEHLVDDLRQWPLAIRTGVHHDQVDHRTGHRAEQARVEVGGPAMRLPDEYDT